MKKIITLGLALVLCLSATTSFSQTCTPIVFIAQSNIQAGYYTPAMGGQNSIPGAIIAIRYRQFIPGESMNAWTLAGSATIANACTGFIAGSQVDTSLMTDRELHQFQGYLVECPDTFWTPILNYRKGKFKKHLFNSQVFSRKEIGINPTVILNPDAFKNADGIIDLSGLEFVSENPDTEAENLLDFVKITNLTNGFTVINPLALPIKVSIYNLNGTLAAEGNNGNEISAERYDFLSSSTFSPGIYFVRVDYLGSSKTEKLFFP